MTALPEDAQVPGRTTVADWDGDQVFEPTEAQPLVPPKRKRGRPVGWRKAATSGDQRLTIRSFAFLRAVAQGISVLDAANRYLDDESIKRQVSAQRRVKELVALISVRIDPSQDESGKAYADLCRVLAPGHVTSATPPPAVFPVVPEPAILAPVPELRPLPVLPTLDQYLESLSSDEVDFYSESEHLENYQEHFVDLIAAHAKRDEQLAAQAVVQQTLHLQPPPETKPAPVVMPQIRREMATMSCLRGLDLLESQMATKPSCTSPTGEWFNAKLTQAWKTQGVLTLADAVHWINIKGRGWHTRLEGIGKRVALRAMDWLLDHEQLIGVRLSPRVAQPVMQERERSYREFASLVGWQPSAGQVLGMWSENGQEASRGQSSVDDVQALQVYGIVPLDNFLWPAHLLGHDGIFRSDRPNTYLAKDDREALQSWVATLANLSSATQDVYRRAIERLVLWAVYEKRVAVSSLSTNHLHEFQNFMQNPPPHWCSTLSVMRYSQDWRPMRGSLSAKSVSQNMSAVCKLFQDWTSAGYLAANAAATIKRARSMDKDLPMDVNRFFSNQQLAAIRTTLHGMPPGPSRNRLRAIILLLQTAGLRRAEAVSLSWSDLKRVRLGLDEGNQWLASFVGKGNKRREVPLAHATYEALREHLHDRLALASTGALPVLLGQSEEEIHIIGILDQRMAEARGPGKGDTPAEAARPGNQSGGLSVSRLHKILKEFFRQVGQQHALELDSQEFERASAHWLRHTFAHHALDATNKNLPVVQALLGHASLATTGIYVKADMSERLAAVNAIRPAV